MGHAAVDEDEGILEGFAGGVGDLVGTEHLMAREEAAAGDAEFGVGFGGGATGDEFDTGPETAGVLPAATGASEPFAEQGASEHDTSFLFGETSGQGAGLAGGAHADGDEGAEQIGGHGQP